MTRAFGEVVIDAHDITLDFYNVMHGWSPGQELATVTLDAHDAKALIAVLQAFICAHEDAHKCAESAPEVADTDLQRPDPAL